MKESFKCAAIVILVGILAGSASSQVVSFQGLGDIAGGSFASQAFDISADGSDLDHGDADYDGDTDGVDFGIWQANYPTNLGGAAMGIPEPATLGLLVLGGLALLRRRR